VGVYVGLLLA